MKKWILIGLALVLVALVVAAMAFGLGTQDTADYTWEEFQALSAAQQQSFYDSFPEKADFDAWASAAREEAGMLYPWEKDGVDPHSYSREEFEALTPEQQEAFSDTFDTPTAFSDWLDSFTDIELPVETLPSNVTWEKPLTDYTWEEFQALDEETQRRFHDSFPSKEAFDDWMIAAQAAAGPVQHPWETGGKQPPEYTWEEYEALNPDQQAAFHDYFGADAAFSQWMDSVAP